MRTLNKPIFLAQIAYCTDFLTVFLLIVQRNLNPSFPLAEGWEKNTQCLTADLCSVLIAVEEAERGPSGLHRFWDRSLDIGKKLSQSAPPEPGQCGRTQVRAWLCPGLSGADMNAPRCSALPDICCCQWWSLSHLTFMAVPKAGPFYSHWKAGPEAPRVRAQGYTGVTK